MAARAKKPEGGPKRRTPKRQPQYRYYIQISTKTAYNGRYERSDWRAWRAISVWPISFATSEEAQAFMQMCFTFKGIEGRKMSACIASYRIRRPVAKSTAEGLAEAA